VQIDLKLFNRAGIQRDWGGWRLQLLNQSEMLPRGLNFIDDTNNRNRKTQCPLINVQFFKCKGHVDCYELSAVSLFQVLVARNKAAILKGLDEGWQPGGGFA
jgi:hypothetical protein